MGWTLPPWPAPAPGGVSPPPMLKTHQRPPHPQNLRGLPPPELWLPRLRQKSWQRRRSSILPPSRPLAQRKLNAKLPPTAAHLPPLKCQKGLCPSPECSVPYQTTWLPRWAVLSSVHLVRLKWMPSMSCIETSSQRVLQYRHLLQRRLPRQLRSIPSSTVHSETRVHSLTKTLILLWL